MELKWKHGKPPQHKLGNNGLEFTLCLLPGFDGTEKLWDPFTARLPCDQQYTLITYPTDIPLTLQELVETAENQIPANVPVVLLALSFSGPIALQILDRKKRNVIGAIFCATFATPPRPALLRFSSLLPIGWLIRTVGMNSRWLIQTLFFEHGTDPALIERFQLVIGDLTPKVIAHRVRILSQLDAHISPRHVDIPCCYLQGRKDNLVPLRAMTVFERTLPGLKTYVIEGPHGLLQSHSEECIKSIQDFTASLDTTT